MMFQVFPCGLVVERASVKASGYYHVDVVFTRTGGDGRVLYGRGDRLSEVDVAVFYPLNVRVAEAVERLFNAVCTGSDASYKVFKKDWRIRELVLDVSFADRVGRGSGSLSFTMYYRKRLMTRAWAVYKSRRQSFEMERGEDGTLVLKYVGRDLNSREINLVRSMLEKSYSLITVYPGLIEFLRVLRAPRLQP